MRVLSKLRASRASHIPGLYLITSICGLIDAACFLALGGVLAELMTGNLLFFAFGWGTGTASFDQLLRYVTAFLPFVVGAFVGGLIIRGPRLLRENRRGFYVEWVLIALATMSAILFQPGQVGYPRELVVALLALAMGIQNALMREHGVSNLATNVMTLTLTGLVADPIRRGKVGHQTSEHKGRQFYSIAIFVVSAAIGAFLVKYSVVLPLLLATVIFTIALYWLIPPCKLIKLAEPAGS